MDRLLLVDDGEVVATTATSDHPLLQRVVDVVRADGTRRRVSYWLHQAPRALKPFDRSVGESLARRGILGEQPGKVLGLFPSTRWPELDPEPERQLRAELRDALLGETEPSTRSLLLGGILQHHAMIDGLVDKPERSRARSRARELVKIAESSGDSVRAAVVAATIAATTSATTAAVISST